MTKETALHAKHAELGASFTDFGGWDMPLKFGNELEEHRAVRTTAGLFDLSHMGEVRISGAQAGEFLDYALLSKYSILKVGKAKYGLLVDDEGHLLDDLITYRLNEAEFYIVPNASNTEGDVAALRQRLADFTAANPEAQVELFDESATTALIAVQGPNSEAILLDTQETEEAKNSIRELAYYAWEAVKIDGLDVLLARTGYTGEDGFELYLPNENAAQLWDKLVAVGAGHDLVPAGLAARDSLRLEAAMPLFGNELTNAKTPIDAGMGGMVTGALKNKGDFVGRAALEALAGKDAPRTLVGLTSADRRAARAGAELKVDGKVVGVVTSGLPSPTLGRPIALADIDAEFAQVGTEVQVAIGRREYLFTVTETPFYKREK